MPLSPAGSKHESPESPPPEPPPPPERQPRASAGEPGSGLREETRLDPIRMVVRNNEDGAEEPHDISALD